MSRKVEPWVGKTDDAMPPPRVRLRIFEAFGGRCALTGQEIKPGDAWDLDHIKPLILGGANDESNLQPVLKDAHKEKTKIDAAIKRKVMRVRKKHLGINTAKAVIPGSKASGWKKRTKRSPTTSSGV